MENQATDEVVNEAVADNDQVEAINLCTDVSKRLIGITGKAGTGKTTILRKVYNLLKEAGYRVALCAPTGKAAKRIREATGIDAVTIHRLLEYPHPGDRDPRTGKALDITRPRRNPNNPLEFDVVLADEYAMVNKEVHRNLVDALPRSGVIRAFGDINQLAPIEPYKSQSGPSPFQHILSGEFPSVTLTTIHRQGEGSGIVANGDRILRGMCPVPRDDFEITTSQDPATKFTNMITRKDFCEQFAGLDGQIIMPTNKGKFGAYVVNILFQQSVQKQLVGWINLPRHSWVESMPVRVNAGDKVIWTQNNYVLEVFNGEVGIVVETSDWGEVIIDFGDRVVTIPPSIEVTTSSGRVALIDPRRDMDLAYAITTHKAQGSEYPKVLYILSRSSFALQCQRNFYTAITRARKHVSVLADTRSLQYSATTKIPKIESAPRK